MDLRRAAPCRPALSSLFERKFGLIVGFCPKVNPCDLERMDKKVPAGVKKILPSPLYNVTW